MTVRKIVREWLEQHGYDGLWSDLGSDGCGCGIDDLFACGEVNADMCVAAHKGADELFYPEGTGGNWKKLMEE